MTESLSVKPRIFFSYAKEDVERVRPLFVAFRQAGFDPWMDTEALTPGQDWKREIRRAIKAADFVVVFISHKSVRKRGYVQAEIKLTLEVLTEIPEGEVFAIPARLDECAVPDALSSFQYCDLFRDHPRTLVSAIEAAWADRHRDNEELFQTFLETSPSKEALGVASDVVLERITAERDRFGAVSTRLSVSRGLKESNARAFWRAYFDGIVARGCTNVFLESGSTVAMIAEALGEHLATRPPSVKRCIRIYTNNLVAAMTLQASNIDTRVLTGSVDPYYGATYAEVAELAEPKSGQTATPPAEAPTLEAMRRRLTSLLSSRGFVCVAVSRLVPHARRVASVGVGGYHNKVMKRCLLSLQYPVACFLDESKWMSPGGSLKHEVFDENLSLASLMARKPFGLFASFEDSTKREQFVEYFDGSGLGLCRAVGDDRGVTTVAFANDMFHDQFGDELMV